MRIGMFCLRLVGVLLLLSCVTHTSLALPFGKGSAVIELTPNSLSTFVNSHKPVVVLFYAPWCGHCKQFHPEFERFAESVKGTIRVGAIDADQHATIAQQFGIRGFPTIKYWKSGTKSLASPQDYPGQRTAAALQSFVVSDISANHVPKVQTMEQLKQAARASPKGKIGVLFSAKDKVPPMLSIMALSPKLKELPLLFSGSSEVGNGAAAAFGVTKLPAFGVLRFTSAEGPVQEKFEFVPYVKAAIAYESVASFFLNCAENDCTGNAGNHVPVDEDSSTAAQQQQEKASNDHASTVALPVTPTAYTPLVIPQFCSPHTRKINGQTPLCIFVLSDRIRLADVHASFQNDPLLFFEAGQHRKELAEQLASEFGIQLTSGDPDTVLAGCVVLLRHSKPSTVRYAVVERIHSEDSLQEVLQRMLNGDVHLTSKHVSSS